MLDVCGGGGGGEVPGRWWWWGEGGSERCPACLPACIHQGWGGGGAAVGAQETDASIELSVIPPQTQTQAGQDLYNLRATRRYNLSLTAAAKKFDPAKHSSRRMLLFQPSQRLMGLIHNLELAAQLCL